MLSLFERMPGGAVLPHPRVLMRNIFPAREDFTTKAHQDFPDVQGTTDVFTAWMPLIDCPMKTGPMQVAAGTHTGEVYYFDIASDAGGIEITNPFEGCWVSGPFGVGDVLIFHSLLVHKGVPNRGVRLRMSMDVRYQPASVTTAPSNAPRQAIRAPDQFCNGLPHGMPIRRSEQGLRRCWTRLPGTAGAGSTLPPPPG